MQHSIVPVPLDPLETVEVEFPTRDCPSDFGSPGFDLSSMRSNDRRIRVAICYQYPEILPLTFLGREILEAAICIPVFMQGTTFLSRYSMNQ